MATPTPEAYFAELEREFPGLRLIPKEHDALSKVIDRLLRIATLGGQRDYLTRYTTVLGLRIYVPMEWDRRSPEERYITLRHEAIHLRQRRRYTFVGMALLYALPLFPVGLAWGRARIEWEAYAETIRAYRDVYGVDAAKSETLRRHIVKQFTSAAYGWMWPFPRMVERWIDEELARL